MNVTVIGPGNIGGTVGRSLAAAGHTVTFGSRHPEAASAVASIGDAVASIGDALAASEVIVVAIPGGAVDAFVADHAAALDGKLLIDASNRMGVAVMNSAAAYRDGAPGTRYARAFNSIGAECIADPVFDGVAADLFFSSPAGDRRTVEALIGDVGLRPVYLGEDPEIVDSVARLWINLVFGQGHGRALAFRTLERAAPEP